MTYPKRTAFLVIDVQNGVVEPCWDSAGTVSRISTAVERARAEGAMLVWVQDEDDAPRGSHDWQLVPPLTPRKSEERVYKTRRDAFMDTNLGELLSTNDVGRVVIAGAQSDYCIRVTAQRAAAEGYDLVLVSDGHTTVDATHDGETISAPQIMAHTNMFFAGLRYTGQVIGTARHDDPHLFYGDVAPVDDGQPAARARN
jgi:nicotinamidase-related amidase